MLFKDKIAALRELLLLTHEVIDTSFEVVVIFFASTIQSAFDHLVWLEGHGVTVWSRGGPVVHRLHHFLRFDGPADAEPAAAGAIDGGNHMARLGAGVAHAASDCDTGAA